MDDSSNNMDKVLDAWIYGSSVILPVRNWKEVHEYAWLLFFKFGSEEIPFQQLSNGDALLLAEKDDLEKVKARIRSLLAKYVKQDVNVPIDLLFVYENVEGR